MNSTRSALVALVFAGALLACAPRVTPTPAPSRDARTLARETPPQPRAPVARDVSAIREPTAPVAPVPANPPDAVAAAESVLSEALAPEAVASEGAASEPIAPEGVASEPLAPEPAHAEPPRLLSSSARPCRITLIETEYDREADDWRQWRISARRRIDVPRVAQTWDEEAPWYPYGDEVAAPPTLDGSSLEAGAMYVPEGGSLVYRFDRRGRTVRVDWDPVANSSDYVFHYRYRCAGRPGAIVTSGAGR